jgi:hypothetical protein
MKQTPSLQGLTSLQVAYKEACPVQLPFLYPCRSEIHLHHYQIQHQNSTMLLVRSEIMNDTFDNNGLKDPLCDNQMEDIPALNNLFELTLQSPQTIQILASFISLDKHITYIAKDRIFINKQG